MLPVIKQHLLFLAKKACFLVEILANEHGCVRTLAGPVGKGEVCECLCACVCVFERELEVCGRKWGKIITANWPEAFFPLPLTQPGHMKDTYRRVLLTPMLLCVCFKKVKKKGRSHHKDETPDESWHRRKAGGSRAPEGDQRDDRIEISASSPSSSPRH